MVVYINTVDVESLTGPAAVERAVNVTMETLKSAAGLTTTLAHFKLSSQGVTITDNKHRSLPHPLLPCLRPPAAALAFCSEALFRPHQ